MGSQSLESSLAAVLIKGYPFILHHLSTPPTECPAIFAAPPRQKTHETYCESHFLSVSINYAGNQLQVFAIEVLIYTTRRLTTLFVSKADSTGYLHVLQLPKGAPSPLKSLATSFLKYLIEHRARPDRRLVLSLFARAQNQYLFPGSVENVHKHVLDDRGLIKWWCRVADPILEEERSGTESNQEAQKDDKASSRQALGYLRVPGYDTYGTKTFFPRDSCRQASINTRWKVADPLVELAESPDLPERCLIPRFPDDPKARFIDTLDEELPDKDHPACQSLTQDARDRVNNGRWRSIRSLEQFWEAMSFRQECSSGRLVGFLWAVFTPWGLKTNQGDDILTQDDRGRPITETVSNQPDGSLKALQDALDQKTPTSEENEVSQAEKEQPEITDVFNWPVGTRGEVVIQQVDYDDVGRVLLSLDYANQNIAAESTRRWIDIVAAKAGVEAWGKTVVGEKGVTPVARPFSNGDSETTILSAGLIRKKKRPADSSNPQQPSEEPGVNQLGAGLVRKKLKASRPASELALTAETQKG